VSVVAGRQRSGIWGAFQVRNPKGKVTAILVAGALAVGCWEWSRYLCGPVGWAEKGLYSETGWDALVNPVSRLVPWVGWGRDQPYPVIVENARGFRLYTDEAKVAGKPWTVIKTNQSPKSLHLLLRAYVYGGSFWRHWWPMWLVWPILFVACLAVGIRVDMARLRKARQTGVFLRGNRLVDAQEWNRRANEETSA
jgi:hypothetical protein